MAGQHYAAERSGQRVKSDSHNWEMASDGGRREERASDIDPKACAPALAWFFSSDALLSARTKYPYQNFRVLM